MTDYTGYTREELIALLTQRDAVGDDVPVLETKIGRLTELRNRMLRFKENLSTTDMVPEELRPGIISLIDARATNVSNQIDKLTAILKSVKP